MGLDLKCRDLTEHATDYLENALPLITRLRVRLHLGLCGMCRAYMDQLRKTIGLLGAVPEQPPEPAVEDRLAAAAHAPPQPGD